jgi:MoaA/NifB/PqqE/SkfB family radical SAM enzyme
MSVEDAATIFPPPFVRQLGSMYMCGNYGDPMVAPDTLAIFRSFRRQNEAMDLGMFTNGSGQKDAFWRELAALSVRCTFAIDGLADTNHVYRRGTHWDKIMSSAAAFIAAGGNACWEFILFEHNQHQVCEAESLARAMGFRRFVTKRTTRFQSDGKLLPRTRILARDGSIEGYLYPPRDASLLNEVHVRLDALARRGPDAGMPRTLLNS